MGWENISTQYLSAVLKANGHQCTLAYDEALFDDKNYLCVPFLAKILDRRKNTIEQIIQSKPDLVAFSVLAVTYRWALEIASEVKKRLNIPIIFGGIHASNVPERCIKEDCIDIVCIGEGEYPLLELCNSIEKGKIDYKIKNLWFKKDGKIIKNPIRPQIPDLNALPLPDKTLFEKHVPMQNYYLGVIGRGCPFACSYCSLSFEAKQWEKIGGKRFRIKSVDAAITELKHYKKKYNYKWVDFRHAVMASDSKWIVEFCKKYKKEINVPFRIFWHPALVTEEAARALKNAGCIAVQMGIESFDERVRREILNRYESNKQIENAIRILEKYKLTYSLDYILGLPTQTEDELIKFAELVSRLKHCYRISAFMLQYLPQTDIVKHGLRYGDLNEKEVERLENGLHDNYMVSGSVSLNKEKLRTMNSFRILYRMMPLLPRKLRKFLLKAKAYKAFRYFPPRPTIFALDLIIGLKDLDGRTMISNYAWYLKRRFLGAA